MDRGATQNMSQTDFTMPTLVLLRYITESGNVCLYVPDDVVEDAWRYAIQQAPKINEDDLAKIITDAAARYREVRT